jgi:hypothetical protein
MSKILIGIVLVVLIAGFAASAYASYNGVGLISSGNPNSRGVFFAFIGGGPDSGK